jgi:class 3 adenylate cyclase
MARSSGRRRLLTVLFVDIVGSTALAERLGDARWRVVLSSFHEVVRSGIRRHGGRHEATTGDGVLATFTEPAQALRAAAAIAAAVQDLGLDVRSGIHSGEVEEIDGKLGGVAVHIGARVTALANAAEVLATSTVRDLVTGSGAAFEDAGDHELRGVSGTWRVCRLTAVELPLPQPLDPEVARSRLELAAVRERHGRRWIVAGALAVAVAAAVIGGVLATRGHAHAAPPTLIALDPKTGRIVDQVHDTVKGCPCGANLFAVNGTLWERAGREGNEVAVRDMKSGRVSRLTAAPLGTVDGAIGFGSLWIMRSIFGMKKQINGVVRLDELSDRKLAYVPLPGRLDGGTIETGNGAVWVLQPDGMLDRIDPATNKLTGRYATHAIETGILLPTGGYEWICECVRHEVLRYDASTRTGKTFQFSEQPWHLIAVATPQGPTLWLLDTDGATLTQIDPVTGQPKEPLGVAGVPTEAVELDGSIWVAAGDVVDRVTIAKHKRSTIRLPAGVHATGIAADPVTDRLWVDNSYVPRQ